MSESEVMRGYMLKLTETISKTETNKLKRMLKDYFIIRGELQINQYSSRRMDDGTVIIASNGKITVHGECIRRVTTHFERLPFQFSKITGEFKISNTGLKSLDGCPITVGRDFSCDVNRLTSLVYGPRQVGGTYSCRLNELTSLEGLPETAGELVLSWSPQTPLLRLIPVQYLVRVSGHGTVNDIIQNHRSFGRGRADILNCQKELLDNGYDGNAAW